MTEPTEADQLILDLAQLLVDTYSGDDQVEELIHRADRLAKRTKAYLMRRGLLTEEDTTHDAPVLR